MKKCLKQLDVIFLRVLKIKGIESGGKMKREHVDKIEEGGILAKPIYTVNGVILMKEGTQLNKEYIQKIKSETIRYIYIKEVEQSALPTIQISDQFNQEIDTLLRTSMATMRDGYLTTDVKVVEKVEQVIQETLANTEIRLYLQKMKDQSNDLLIHAMNVCVVAVLIGKKMAYTDNQLKYLSLGALLHDIGKVSLEYCRNRTSETVKEYSYGEDKEHVRYGYTMLKEMPRMSLLAANIALTHHERYDGSGFPLGKKNTAIHEFARIVAVANKYDHLLNEEVEEEQLKHDEIVEQIISRAYTWFDPEVIKVFRHAISPYPLKTEVRLNDGRIGTVVQLNKAAPTRPIIAIKEAATGKEIERVDLSEALSLLIIG